MKIKRHVMFCGFLIAICAALTGCKTGELWSTPTYKWADDHSECTAARVFAIDGSEQSETEQSIKEIIKEATCLEEGTAKYTVDFKISAFKQQVYTESIPKSDHQYEEEVRFPNIFADGEKVFTCKICGNTYSEPLNKIEDATNYTLDASRIEALPGVYQAKAVPGADKAKDTIGIPLIAKQNLVNYPTYESPAIIQGAAVNYEVKTGAVEYQPIPGKELIAPYEYFRYTITEVESKNADGNITKYKKLSGFDGTYYIIRLDMTDIVKNQTGYLHVEFTDNKALMVLVGMLDGVDTGVAAADASGNATTRPTIKDGYWYIGDNNTNIQVKTNHNNSLAYAGTNGNWFVGGTGFADGMGKKVVSYSLEDNASLLKDKTGNLKDTPYLDIILLSSSKLTAGADAGKETAPTADVSMSFYIDDVLDYDPELVFDPASQDVNHQANVMKKFYDGDKYATGRNKTSYLIKGDDLELDVVTTETRNEQDVNQYWSLEKAINYQEYDRHTLKLMCEVPVLQSLHVKSINGENREISLDVNSFDIQIANHSETNAAGLKVSDNASLRILDHSNTSGAELAIGNNATMEVGNGGTMIIDKTCQLEVEYDAASKVHDTTHYEVSEVIAKIDALPDPSAVKEADRVNIDAAKDAYDALNNEEQGQVTNVDKLNNCIAALPKEVPLTNGMITVQSGGKIINEGVINIEGLEVKPAGNNSQETSQVTERDMQAAALIVEDGAILDNYGCVSVKGSLYVMGTLNNYGRYNDLIAATDPDKGIVNLHKGIQVTWKDDITVLKEGSTTEYTVNPDVKPGAIYVGIDGNGKINQNACLNNYGDIVLVPGDLVVYGTYNNLKNEDETAGNLYLCAVSEAVVPIVPDPQDPTKLEERRQFDPAYGSNFDLIHARSFNNEGKVANAKVEIIGNGLFGALTEIQ